MSSGASRLTDAVRQYPAPGTDDGKMMMIHKCLTRVSLLENIMFVCFDAQLRNINANFRWWRDKLGKQNY